MGLEKTSKKVKQAMQFGSRSAKVNRAGRGKGCGARSAEETRDEDLEVALRINCEE